MLVDCRDVLADWLDSLHGSTVTDKSVFDDLAKKFEAEYHSDMEALNVSKYLNISLHFNVWYIWNVMKYVRY